MHTMQLVLKRGSIDKPLTFDVVLIQLVFIPNACKGVFNANVAIFQSNCAEGLHFSDFHYIIIASDIHKVTGHASVSLYVSIHAQS